MWTIFTIFISLLEICGSINEKKFSKIICTLRKFDHATILQESSIKLVNLSKNLFQECSIKVIIVSDVRNIGKNQVIFFANHERDNKETL